MRELSSIARLRERSHGGDCIEGLLLALRISLPYQREPIVGPLAVVDSL